MYRSYETTKRLDREGQRARGGRRGAERGGCTILMCAQVVARGQNRGSVNYFISDGPPPLSFGSGAPERVINLEGIYQIIIRGRCTAAGAFVVWTGDESSLFDVHCFGITWEEGLFARLGRRARDLEVGWRVSSRGAGGVCWGVRWFYLLFR